ncbi:hypothetical protein SNEBB_006417 [Seison nebaliae]|nr:hypothetical protein SNEBB_006417 [Seison nebaliae]
MSTVSKHNNRTESTVLDLFEKQNIERHLDVNLDELEKSNKDYRNETKDELERRKKAKQIVISTDDSQVKKDLRKLGEPICLFGEGPVDRRLRLQDIITRLPTDVLTKVFENDDDDNEKNNQENEQDKTIWYHKGSLHLEKCRLDIARMSMKNVERRLGKLMKLKGSLSKDDQTYRMKEIYRRLRSTHNQFTQMSDTRPIFHIRFSPDASMFATASWSGCCRIWNTNDLSELRELKGHTNSASCIEWHPNSSQSENMNSCNLISSDFEGNIFLWNLNDDVPMGAIETHIPYRVPKLKIDKSGRYLATACIDHSWRLYDLEMNMEILHQEGHSNVVQDLTFQPDTSLICTAGRDSFGRLWDLRTGRCVMVLDGHLRTITSIDYSINGFHIATGSADNSVKIWDVRNIKNLYTIAAHKHLISAVKYDANYADFLFTSSYDQTIKTWSNPGWSNLKVLDAHSMVMSMDLHTMQNDGDIPDSIIKKNQLTNDDVDMEKVIEDENQDDDSFISNYKDYLHQKYWVLSSAYDRTIKLWKSE